MQEKGTLKLKYNKVVKCCAVEQNARIVFGTQIADIFW